MNIFELAEITEKNREEKIDRELTSDKYPLFLELDKAIQSIHTSMELKTEPEPGWFPLWRQSLYSFIFNEMNLERHGPNVLDLGSGTGSSSIIWSYFGFNVTGIEMSEKAYNVARKDMLALNDSLKSKGTLQFYHGSYYPSDYIKDLLAKKSLKFSGPQRTIEQAAIQTSIPENVKICEDIYKKHSIDWNSFDIIFTYAWPNQMLHILDIFQKYARSGSTLVGFVPNTYWLERFILQTSSDKSIILSTESGTRHRLSTVYTS